MYYKKTYSAEVRANGGAQQPNLEAAKELIKELEAEKKRLVAKLEVQQRIIDLQAEHATRLRGRLTVAKRTQSLLASALVTE